MNGFIEEKTGEITRPRIIRYAGVIGDFNPIHYDDGFAKQAGLPSAIAHGPLTFAMALDVLVSRYGKENLAGLSCRFKAPVFPGNTLSVSCTDEGLVSAKVDGNPVLEGQVVLK